MSAEDVELINEFAVVSETGFIRVEGPFEVAKNGTRWAIMVPGDDEDYSYPGRGPYSLLGDTLEGDGIALVAGGQVVGGGIVDEVLEPEGEEEKHVIADQYAIEEVDV